MEVSRRERELGHWRGRVWVGVFGWSMERGAAKGVMGMWEQQ